jgi:hypothetical protein
MAMEEVEKVGDRTTHILPFVNSLVGAGLGINFEFNR